MHDIGLLHIDPQILGKQGGFSGPEWRAIQSHVMVGEIVLESTADIQPRLARAVLEHHERCDGSGYPTGKTDDQLDILGQVVGMADSIQSIRVHQYQQRGRNLMDLLPYLHMNAETHFHEVYQAVAALLHEAQLRPSAADPQTDVISLAKTLRQRGAALCDGATQLAGTGLHEVAERWRKHKHGAALCKILNHVNTVVTESGLLDARLFQWLDRLIEKPNNDILVELNELELMQDEFNWQLRNARRVIGAVIDVMRATDAGACHVLETAAEKVDACLGAVEGA